MEDYSLTLRCELPDCPEVARFKADIGLIADRVICDRHFFEHKFWRREHRLLLPQEIEKGLDAPIDTQQAR